MDCFSAVAQRIGIRKLTRRVLFLGLDNSGKTTILHYINARHKGAGGRAAPTIGFQTHEVEYNNVRIIATDMAGTARYRSLWEKCYGDNDGIVFVVDASDKLRYCVVKDEIENLLESVAASRLPILFLFTKVGLCGGMNKDNTIRAVGLDNIKDRPWNAFEANIRQGSGIQNGIDWLLDSIDNYKNSQQAFTTMRRT